MSETPYNEFKAWSDWLSTRRGKWTIDPIHNGRDRDFVAFLPDVDDPTHGIFVQASGPCVEAGTYDGGFPRPIDGFFYPKYGYCFRGGPKTWKAGSDKPTQPALGSIYTLLGEPIIQAARELEDFLSRQRGI